LSDPLFVQLAFRDENDPEWLAYQSQYPDDAEHIMKARFLLLSSERFPKQKLGADRKDVIWNLIQNDIDVPSAGGNRYAGVYKLWPAWAAAAILLMAGLLFLNNDRSMGDNSVEALSEQILTEKVNNKQVVYPMILPDGSTVLLAPESSIRYSVQGFESHRSREVFLSGEAFFEVVPDPEVPFYVFTEGLTTRVLGTSFNVRAIPGEKQVEVAVKTGRVAVLATPGEASPLAAAPAEEEILHPDDKIIMDLESRTLSFGKVKKSEQPPQREEVIDDVAVTEVFAELEQLYGIKVRFQEERLKDCRITAVFTGETFYEKIRLICKGIGARYSVTEGAVHIESEGCDASS